MDRTVDEFTVGEIVGGEIRDTVDGFEVPVDPMELLQCDSCQ